MKPFVVVLGMHRSGTSAVMRVLSALGCEVGPADGLVAPNDENPHGFFELKLLREVCDSLLARMGAEWWRVGPLQQLDSTRPLKRRELEHLNAIVAMARSSTSALALKEPRLCLLWPILRPWFPDVAFVHVFRDPRSVARSLEKRNAMSHELSIGLWEIHNKRATNARQGVETALVSYDELCEDPLEVCSMLARWLQEQQLVDAAADDARIAKAAASVDTALNRAKAATLDCDVEQALRFHEGLKDHAAGRRHLRAQDLFIVAARWRAVHELGASRPENARAAKEL